MVAAKSLLALVPCLVTPLLSSFSIPSKNNAAVIGGGGSSTPLEKVNKMLLLTVFPKSEDEWDVTIRFEMGAYYYNSHPFFVVDVFAAEEALDKVFKKGRADFTNLDSSCPTKEEVELTTTNAYEPGNTKPVVTGRVYLESKTFTDPLNGGTKFSFKFSKAYLKEIIHRGGCGKIVVCAYPEGYSLSTALGASIDIQGLTSPTINGLANYNSPRNFINHSEDGFGNGNLLMGGSESFEFQGFSKDYNSENPFTLPLNRFKLSYSNTEQGKPGALKTPTGYLIALTYPTDYWPNLGSFHLRHELIIDPALYTRAWKPLIAAKCINVKFVPTDSSNNFYELKFDEDIYFNQGTFDMARSAINPSYIPTSQWMHPKRDYQAMNGREFALYFPNLGINKTVFFLPFKYHSNTHLFGNCVTSSYCIVNTTNKIEPGLSATTRVIVND
jgi:hypothetical protein